MSSLLCQVFVSLLYRRRDGELCLVTKWKVWSYLRGASAKPFLLCSMSSPRHPVPWAAQSHPSKQVCFWLSALCKAVFPIQRLWKGDRASFPLFFLLSQLSNEHRVGLAQTGTVLGLGTLKHFFVEFWCCLLSHWQSRLIPSYYYSKTYRFT